MVLFHQIHIRSDRFPRLEGEEEEFLQPGTGTYGKALALYLMDHYHGRGYSAPFVVCRANHWLVAITSHAVQLTCREYGGPNHYLCDLLGKEHAPEDYLRAKKDLKEALYGVKGIQVLSEELGEL